MIIRRKKVAKKIDGGVEEIKKEEKRGNGFEEVKKSYQSFQNNPKTIKAKENIKDFGKEYKRLMRDSFSGFLPDSFKRGEF